MMFCKYCGKKLEYKDGKCLNCGSSLEKLESYREINIEKKEKTNKEIETKHEFDNEDGPIEIVYMPKEDHSIKFDIGKIKRAVFLVSFVVVGVLVIGGITFFYNKKNDIKSSGNNSIREESSAKINDEKDKSSIDNSNKQEETSKSIENITGNSNPTDETTEVTTNNNGARNSENYFGEYKNASIGPKRKPDEAWDEIKVKEISGSNGVHFYVPEEWNKSSEDIGNTEVTNEKYVCSNSNGAGECEEPENSDKETLVFENNDYKYLVEIYCVNNESLTKDDYYTTDDEHNDNNEYNQDDNYDNDKYKIGSINNDYWICVKITPDDKESQENKDDIIDKIYETAWVK